MTVGSLQKWSGWTTSDSSWCEGVWNKEWGQNGRKSELVSMERSEEVNDAVVKESDSSRSDVHMKRK